MTITDFRKQVAGFMNRTEASFVVNEYDILDRAIHKARKWAERRNDFEMAKIDVIVPNVSVTNGALLSTAVSVDDEEVTVDVKTIINGFLPFQGVSGGYFPIPVSSRKAHMERLKRRYADMQTTADAMTQGSVPPSQFSVVRQNTKVYVIGASEQAMGASTFDLRLEVYRWMPEYDAEDNPTDFFLEHCEDFMLLRSIVELNFFLKEDQRIPISARALQDAWDSVVTWDKTMAGSDAADTTLD